MGRVLSSRETRSPPCPPQQSFPLTAPFVESLKGGGQAAIVIKNTFLSSTDGASLAIREQLMDDCNLHTILDCLGGTFLGAGVKNVVLFFERGRSTKDFWYYQLDPGRNI